jgi:U3 small nucleolar RNA-associated protein 3
MENSISLINIRAEAMIEFCRYLSLLTIMKLNGDSIENHPIIKRLIFLKTFLTKLKPISKKIEYQIGKMIRVSMKSKFDDREILQNSSKSKANLGNFDLDDEDDEGQELSDEEGKKGDKTKVKIGPDGKKTKLTYMVSNPENKNVKKKGTKEDKMRDKF